MSAFVVVAAQLAVQLVLLVVVPVVVVFAAWVFWDCLAGPSAQLARENARRRAAAEVDA